MSVTDVTNHLCAKLLGQHLVRDAHNWHLNTADRKPHKLNCALPFPALPTTSLSSKKKRGDTMKGEGKESEMLAGKSWSCLSKGAKQELASKRLKAASLI